MAFISMTIFTKDHDGERVRGAEPMTDTSQPTGHHDRHGIPIHVGDLIRVESYRGSRGRTMWTYGCVAVIDGRHVFQDWRDRNPRNYVCLLMAVNFSLAEVIDGANKGPSGEIVTFNERPRKKVNQ